MKRDHRASGTSQKFSLSRILPGIVAISLVASQPVITLAYENNTDITERSSARDFSYDHTASADFLSAASGQRTNRVATNTHIRLSFAGTALVAPGAMKTVKKPEPEPEPVPEPIVEEVVVPTSAPVQVAAAPAPAPVAKPAPKSPQPLPDTSGIAIRWGGANKAGGWFPYGYCTYQAALDRGGVDFGGNANQWLGNARAAGYNTGSVPVVNAIFVTAESGWGHVGTVIKVNSDGSFVTREMNYVGFGVVSSRTLRPSQTLGFIY